MDTFDRSIKLGLEFSDLATIRIDNLYNLLRNLEIVDINSREIFNKESLPKNNPDAILRERILENGKRAHIAAINKNSPLKMEIIFGSIGSYLIITSIAGKIDRRKWSLSRRRKIEELQKLEFDSRVEYVSALERSENLINEIDEGLYDYFIDFMADRFQSNQLSLEGIHILEEQMA